MIFNLDSWEEQYINSLSDKDVMAWGDQEAFYRYPKYNFVYDKLYLSKLTNIRTWDLTHEMPNMYPVIVKPRKNLFGLSKNAYIAFNDTEVEDFDDYIAQEYLNGEQHTTDVYIKDGKIIARYPFWTHKNGYDEITCFSSLKHVNRIAERVVEDILDGYTGIANFEDINGKVTEIHLRPSLQFFDICGGFVEQMPRFVKNGVKPIMRWENTYSRVYRTRHSGIVTDSFIPNNKPPEVRSVQLAWESNKPLYVTDPSLFRKRYMIINGTDLAKIEEYAKMCKIWTKEV